MHRTFSGRHISFNPFMEFLSMCGCMHLGGGVGVPKGLGRGGHIKMITHCKTAAFMVFFLLYFFLYIGAWIRVRTSNGLQEMKIYNISIF